MAAHGDHGRCAVDLAQQGGEARFVQPQEARAHEPRDRQFALDVAGGGDADETSRSVFPDELRQGLQRRLGRPEALQQRREGARTDVLRAPQPQPGEAACVVERMALAHAGSRLLPPIRLSVPAESRPMLALCFHHSTIAKPANRIAASGRCSRASTTGVSALATSAAADE